MSYKKGETAQDMINKLHPVSEGNGKIQNQRPLVRDWGINQTPENVCLLFFAVHCRPLKLFSQKFFFCRLQSFFLCSEK